MDEHRSQRVSEAVKAELSELIGFEMEDPRLRSVISHDWRRFPRICATLT